MVNAADGGGGQLTWLTPPMARLKAAVRKGQFAAAHAVRCDFLAK